MTLEVLKAKKMKSKINSNFLIKVLKEKYYLTNKHINYFEKINFIRKIQKIFKITLFLHIFFAILQLEESQPISLPLF
jgi:hypothetical protein